MQMVLKTMKLDEINMEVSVDSGHSNINVKVKGRNEEVARKGGRKTTRRVSYPGNQRRKCSKGINCVHSGDRSSR